jgi:type II secretory pathway pseudopilin PulG
MRNARSRSGLDVLVVFTILVLLAAIVVPRLTPGDPGGPTAAMTLGLMQLRTAIDTYWTQHDGFPGPDAAAVRTQLTRRTDRAGRPGDGAAHALGPYLHHGIPDNPLTGDDSLAVVPSMPNQPDGTSAWLYCPASGEVRCNVAGAAPGGLAWFRF